MTIGHSTGACNIANDVNVESAGGAAKTSLDHAAADFFRTSFNPMRSVPVWYSTAIWSTGPHDSEDDQGDSITRGTCAPCSTVVVRQVNTSKRTSSLPPAHRCPPLEFDDASRPRHVVTEGEVQRRKTSYRFRITVGNRQVGSLGCAHGNVQPTERGINHTE